MSRAVGIWGLSKGAGEFTSPDQLLDSSGNGNDGTSANAVVHGAGTRGASNAMVFNGVDDFVSILDHPNLGGMSELTVSCWIKLNVLPSDAGEKKIINLKRHNSYPWVSWELGIETDNKLRFLTVGDTELRFSSVGDTALIINTWYHVMGIYNGTDFRIFLNGADDTAVVRTLSGTVFDSDDYLVIGSNIGSNTFDGSIANVRLYDSVLDFSEIKRIYNAQRPIIYPPTNGLVGFWSLNSRGARGTTIYDIMGNSHGTSANSPVWTNDQQGVANGAMVFNGSSDYVDIPVINLKQSHSISTWFKHPDVSGAIKAIIVQDADLYDLHLYTNGKLRYFISGAPFLESPSSYDDNEWHNVVVTFDDDSNYLRMYVDDSVVDEESYAGALPDIGSVYRIGRRGSSATPNYFNGAIADIRIYNRALTEDEIGIIYNYELTGIPQ